MENVFVTNHVMDRLKERFSTFYNNNEILCNWKKELGTNCLNKYFSNLLKNLNVNKSYLNNTTYMIHLYEKYGYDLEYQFIEYEAENILFILSKKRNEKVFKVVTCYHLNGGHLTKTKKYKVKEKIKNISQKEEIHFLNKDKNITLELKIKTLIQDGKFEIADVLKDIKKVSVDGSVYFCTYQKNKIIINDEKSGFFNPINESLRNNKILLNDNKYMGFHDNKKYEFLLNNGNEIFILKEEELFNKTLTAKCSKEEKEKINQLYEVGNFKLIEKFSKNKKIISCMLQEKEYIVFVNNSLKNLEKFCIKEINRKVNDA